MDRTKALEIATACVNYVDILEAGTPLIKACGIGIVRRLATLRKPVCADLKTFDAGGLEASLAAAQGAKYATVLAAAGERTIAEFAGTCSKLGVKSVADMMTEPLERLKLLERLGVSYVAVHSGIDEQREGSSPLKQLRKARAFTSIPLVVAGGIRLDDLDLVVPYADIVVVGSAITRARDPAREAASIKRRFEEIRRRYPTHRAPPQP